MRTVNITASLTVLDIALAACGDGRTSEPTVAALSLMTTGTLTVCAEASYPPFELQDNSGEWTGFDIDLMRAIADELGDLRLEVTAQPFEEIWLAPQSGTCDIAASAITITDERQAEALFSDPYFDVDQSLLVRAVDADVLVNAASLVAKKVAVKSATTGEIYAVENFAGARLVPFDEPSAMYLALLNNEVDAVVQDLPANSEQARSNDAFAVSATFPTGEQYGFAVSAENPALLSAVNAALTAARTSGTYDDLVDTYFEAAG